MTVDESGPGQARPGKEIKYLWLKRETWGLVKENGNNFFSSYFHYSSLPHKTYTQSQLALGEDENVIDC